MQNIALLFRLPGTGINELDEPINKAWTVFSGLIIVFGVIWFVISLIQFGFAVGDENPHQKKSAVKNIVGALIIAAAGAIATFVLGV